MENILLKIIQAADYAIERAEHGIILSLIHIYDDWANDASDKFVTNGAFTLKEWKHDSSTVSYTHLDVYKRQSAYR